VYIISLHGSTLLFEEFRLFIDVFEYIRVLPDSLGGAEHQYTIFFEAVVEQGYELLLCICIEIDEEVTAAYQLEGGKRGVLENIVDGEDDQIAYFSFDDIKVVLLYEIPFQPVHTHIRFDAVRVAPVTGPLDGCGIDVGGKYLDGDMQSPSLEHLFEDDTERVDFLACGTSRDPYPYSLIPVPVGKHVREHVLFKGFEGLVFPEK
jgi:hypothetical protein